MEILDVFEYLYVSASPQIADRLLVSLEESAQFLAESPFSGSAVNSQNSKLAGVRKWRIKGFENYLIFYRIVPNGIETVRVLHGARNWSILLD